MKDGDKTTETDVLIGDYKPGIDDIYEEYSGSGNVSKKENHEMSDFSVNQIQVAVVRKSDTSEFAVEKYSESVQIYLPGEREA